MSHPFPIGIFSMGALHAAGESAADLQAALSGARACLSAFDDEHSTAVGRLHATAAKRLALREHTDRHFRRLDRTAQLAILAGEDALKALSDIGLAPAQRTATLIASSRGPTLNWEREHSLYIDYTEQAERLSPFASPTTTPGHLSSAVQQALGLTGPAFSLSMTCSSGLWAVANAITWLHAGWVDAALAGGTEAALSGFTLAQMASLKVLNQQPDAPYPSTPFAAGGQNSMALGEGAALFWLAPLDDTDAKPLARIVGFGFGSEQIPNHAGITAEGGNLRTAMQMACGDVRPDLILAHAPGTIKGDAAELAAIHECFGQQMPAVYSNKWCIGHTFGAAGALNLAQAVQVLASGACPALPYLPEAQATQDVKRVLINAVGFGGVAASLLVEI
ncbi:MAG: beta-ketoacyl synthase N-terminal-like domain-containing protein [Bacteroidota bacterium]